MIDYGGPNIKHLFSGGRKEISQVRSHLVVPVFDILLPCLPRSWRTALKCGIEPDKLPALRRRSEEAICDEIDIRDDRLLETHKGSSV